jgi:hypothetical protein
MSTLRRLHLATTCYYNLLLRHPLALRKHHDFIRLPITNLGSALCVLENFFQRLPSPSLIM